MTDRRALGDPLARLHPVVRLAPAKLNLTLIVLGSLPGGYHALHSVAVPLEMADRLSLAVVPAAREDTLTVTAATPEGDPIGPPRVGGPFDPGPVKDNLVWRAVQLARRAVGPRWPGAPAPPPALAVRLEKRIPVAAGLGGGSSDAAAALDGALEAWGTELSLEERRALAAGLGSDVPFFFLAAGPALLEGRGERVTPLASLIGPPPAVLLVVPDVRLPTAAVFAVHDTLPTPSDAGPRRAASIHLAAELARGLTAEALLARAGILARANDLVAAADALVPELASFRRGLARLLGRPVGLSGSGPTCWVLYPSVAGAGPDIEAVAERVRGAITAGILEPPAGRPPLVLATRIAGAVVHPGQASRPPGENGGDGDDRRAPPRRH